MRETAIRHIPARDEEYQMAILCDLCGARSTYAHDWTTENYEVKETTILYKDGTSYPDGGSGEEIRIDLCPACFLEKLIPWLKSQGATPMPQKWDW